MSSTHVTKYQFNEVIELLNIGNIQLAEKKCREAIDTHPDDETMLGLLGAILFKSDRLDEAEQCLRKTIALAPSFAKPHEDLGLLLFRKGDFEETVKVLRKAVNLDPLLDVSFFTLGKALGNLGRGKEADEAYEKSFELSPQRKLMAQGLALHRQGKFREAENTYRKILETQPDNVDVMRLLGLVVFTGNREYEAEKYLRRALALAPDFVDALIDLGNVYKESHRLEEAIECFKKATELSPGAVKAHFLLGSTMAPASLTFDAIESYRKALELKPDHTGAYLGIGHVLKTVGEIDEAIDAYRKCIELNPDHGEAYWSLSNLKTYKFDDQDIKNMQERLDNSAMDAKSKVSFLFTLAKACEDHGDYDSAWKHYDEGNRIRRESEKYDPVYTESIHEAVINVFNKGLFEKNSTAGVKDESAIFILGLPRSGSTLQEQILASHSLVEGTSELPYLSRVAISLNRNRADGVNYPEAVRELSDSHFMKLGNDYLEYAKMHRSADTPYFIDKMPNNFSLIGFLHLIMPKAKIIDARRHPLDACLSCYRQLFAKGQAFTYDLVEIGEYYLQYQKMMDFWHEVLPGKVLTVQYEEVVTDFENQVSKILQHCNLPWEDECLTFYETERPVRTPSSEQVRQPIYTGSINHSKKYARHLGELIEVLEPILPRYEHLLELGK
ncbi:MAG: tetratricopeptide repeat protein [Gammaproteobacteria bacterium]|nr:tetratricopeptide repeat protein [Gammaproteobacteria bacterium]